MKASYWNRVSHWSHGHPWALTGFFLGVGVGVIFCLPLLPFTIPDSAAQLIGSFLGAAIAVSGAIWVTTIKERKFRSDLRLAAIVIHEPFIDSLAERMADIVLLNGQTAPLDQSAIESLEFGKNLATVTRSSFDDLRPAFSSTPNDIIVHRHLLGAMDRFIAFFDAELKRDQSRRMRRDQERQSIFNRPDMPRTTPAPVDAGALLAAIDNSKAVMDTVGR